MCVSVSVPASVCQVRFLIAFLIAEGRAVRMKKGEWGKGTNSNYFTSDFLPINVAKRTVIPMASNSRGVINCHVQEVGSSLSLLSASLQLLSAVADPQIFGKKANFCPSHLQTGTAFHTIRGPFLYGSTLGCNNKTLDSDTNFLLNFSNSWT